MPHDSLLADAPASQRSYTLHGQRITAPSLRPGLHVVSTPIGNLADVTLRALTTLAAADLVVCEDTRVTSRLTNHYGIEASLVAYNDHNAPRVRPQILERLAQGAAVALVSDAGTPMVSDPGYKLVRDAIEEGIAVSSAPGASAALAALTVAGLPTDRFFFEGFLPPKDGARANRLAELKAVPATLVFYESGPRLAGSLAAMATALGDRAATVARELTKAYETVYRGTLVSLATDFAVAEEPRGEIVVVVGPPVEERASADEMEASLSSALDTLSVKDAAAAVAARLGLPRRGVYARAVELAAARRARGP
ncbi:16S rRNA (cytidine(1402)-2'-O)-methyltransferase [Labrys wisconsinensis]|uniref:Ribosomal RNA small subunit methyltransferase I n=1 Tax=Labrys wisconsinensis TaxID=425677 RepID=A0ABU0JDZ8_9HYPH|nr:16S rRNA (cytidine(1402)-2'-O)-methyltransferase [Labrys wisconsinensis]MDQ0472491.1 16S rRNA (cytidine1402-2'-O)-methyltransferase [Labrys wisconsinensis]